MAYRFENLAKFWKTKNKNDINILFLDKEGGYGGSSRSLYFLIKNLDRFSFKPYVMLREEGPMLDSYADLGVETFVRKGMPVYKPSLRNNLYVLFRFLLQIPNFIRSFRFLSRIITDYKIDILHVNHDSFFVYGVLLKYLKGTKIVIHMRTMLPMNCFARFQAQCISKIADHLIFISENELWQFLKLSRPATQQSSVIFNSAEVVMEKSFQLRVMDFPGELFKVLYLGNLTYNKGVDRLLVIAAELKTMGVDNVLFIVCGADRQRKGKNTEKMIEKQAETDGIADYFVFMGHQSPPDPFCQQAHILIRPSRLDDPWGRDIIEAMAYGKPVLATGIYDNFVQNGVNGYLFPEFDAKKIGEKIIYLSEHPKVVEKMRKENIEKAKRLFDGPTNAAKVAAIYDSILNCS